MAPKPAVLITRPAGQTRALCAGLKSLGFLSHSQPMLELVPLEVLGSAQNQCLVRLDQYQHVIFISGNAVNFGMKWIVEAWPEGNMAHLSAESALYCRIFTEGL